MKIENDEQLAAAVKQSSALLQAITDYTARSARSDAAIRFPRGFLRTAEEHRDRLSFVTDKDLRSNLAYTLMMSDSVYWLLMRTDISGMAREMLIKLFVFIGGALVESITKAYLKGFCGKGYKERTEYLVSKDIIGVDLKVELDWLWDTRNNMHLFTLDGSEYINEYSSTTQKRCVAAFKQLAQVLGAKGPLVPA